jgi:hypothetical protein
LLSSKNKSLKAWTLLSMLFLFINTNAQQTFNKRFYYEHSTRMESVHLLEDGYISAGWSSDPSDGNHFDLLLVNFDLYGSISDVQRYGNIERYFWSAGRSKSENLNLFIQQSVGPRDDTAAVNLTWFNGNGDTLFTRDFRSLYLNQGWTLDYFISPPYSYLFQDSTAYLTAIISHDSTYSDAVLYKLDSQGHELWHYVHATLSDPDAIYAVVPHGDGVIAGINQFIYVEDSTNVLFKKFSSDGDAIWEIDSNEFIDDALSCSSLILDNDSLIGCGKVLPYDVNDYYPIASIFKIDTLGHLIWSNTYGDYTNYEWREFTDVVKTSDGNYVCGGTWTSIPGSEEIPEGQVSADYDQFAHIVKFDRDNGEIIWERKYRWLETYRDNHTLNDMKATPDGGVIFCGEANDTYHFYDPPYQQGWVVKLDACGCLVPGCDETCAVGVENEIITQTPIIKLGPNPANDLLNVFVGKLTNFDPNQSHITIFDKNGKEIKSIPIKYDDTTYMVDVSSYPTGQYILQLQSNRHTHSSSKFEVVR